MRVPGSSLLIFALAVSVPATSATADVIGPDDAPPHISFTDGEVWLDREGDSQPAEVGLPFLPGDRLRSTVGRTEILFPDGTALHLDDGVSIELLGPTLLRLTSGRLRLLVAGPSVHYAPSAASQRVTFQIDTPAASAVITAAGEYGVDVRDGPSGPETVLAVARGWATLSTDFGDLSLRAGERSVTPPGQPPSPPHAFNAAAFDTFDLWSAARRDARMGRASHSTHLPRELQMYGGILEREGNWHHEAEYGYVWYPSVPVDWHPYLHGYWSDVPVYGWTWIGAHRWAWPTHHYGRWAHVRSRWFWVPGRTWRAAWVHWAVSPGYVGWSPWGFAHRSALGFSFSAGHPGWIVVPRDAFGRRGSSGWGHARSHPVPRDTRFVVQDRPPVPHVVRGTRVAADAGRRVAVPRSAAQPGVRAIPQAGQAAFDRGGASPGASAWTTRRAPARTEQAQPGQPPSARSPRAEVQEPAPVTPRAPRAGWTAPQQAVERPAEVRPPARQVPRTPAAAAPAQPPPAEAAPAQVPAGTAGWSSRPRAVPRS